MSSRNQEKTTENLTIEEFHRKYSDLSVETINHFIKIYTRHLPTAYREFLSKEDLQAFLLHRLQFMAQRKEREPLIRTAEGSTQEIWLTNSLILEFVTDDSPFIVDSVIDFLHSEGYAIKAAMHPVFTVKRENGRLKNIRKAFETGDGEKRESTCLFILENRAGIDSDKLLAEINEILQTIGVVVDDFKPMLTEVEQAARNDSEKALVKWLFEDNFIFLGTSQRRNNLGIFKRRGIKEVLSRPFDSEEKEIAFRRTAYRSRVNKKRNVLLIRLSNSLLIAGIFTFRADSTSAAKIPVLKERVESVFSASGSDWTHFDRKDFLFSLNLFPLEYIFTRPFRVMLEQVQTVTEARLQVEGAVNISKDSAGIYLMALWPLHRYNDRLFSNFRSFIEKNGLRELSIIRKTLFASVFIFADCRSAEDEAVEFNTTEKELELYDLLLDWEQRLRKLIEREFTNEEILKYEQKYMGAVPVTYKQRENVKTALSDIKHLVSLDTGETKLRFIYDHNSETSYLKVYTFRPKSLSYFVPLLDHFRLEVLNEESYIFNFPEADRYLYKFYFNFNEKPLKDKDDLKRLEHAFTAVYDGEETADHLNALVLSAGVDIHQVRLLKALIGYTYQVSGVHSRLSMKNAMLNKPELAVLLIRNFEVRFLPWLFENRTEMFRENEYIAKLQPLFPRTAFNRTDIQQLVIESRKRLENFNFSNLHEAEISNQLKTVISAIVRTDYFQVKPSITFKLKTEKILFARRPVPFAEIWVYHPRFEGVHLRGGKIARGGLRWSDRPDDFRTEVWGLWKTQMLKNTVIVPTGAKGGFVLRDGHTRDDAVAAYREFIASLITLTDNRENKSIVHPPAVPVLDEEDSYLVVAADKGTATFSDYANEVSTGKGFWLRDAFASGGEHGYNHKDYGITANGSWESARWHFYRLNKDPLIDEFTVTAIGDMSGDVFGNGMLFTSKIRLVAAFNHMHIFIDPEPDAEKTYEERKRLFDLGRSSWEDYNTELISEGGGIFKRNSVSISLTPQIQSVLATDESEVSGEKLIQLILQAPVDMLFNGGIGTYVKASHETHAQVRDFSNDRVRVDADSLRCFMVVEGGNLGMTTSARIEYARQGGLLNTDAVDNAGGVDMSDHEVNLKIALKKLIDSGTIKDEDERNRILEKYGAEVTALVLESNFSQNHALAYSDILPAEEKNFQIDAFDTLEKEGVFSRESATVPPADELKRDLQVRGVLPRPLNCALLAYVKFYAAETWQENLFADKVEFLADYFPADFRKYTEATLEHPLKDEILKAEIINYVLDRAGTGFIEKCSRYLDLSPSEALCKYLVADTLLNAEDFRRGEYTVNISERRFPSEVRYENALLLYDLTEKSIFRYIEMEVLFPLDDETDRRTKPVSMVADDFSRQFLPPFAAHLPESVKKEIITEWMHIEMRYIVTHRLKATGEIESFFRYYINNDLINLKRALYSIYPESIWDIRLMISIKRNFWKGVVTAYRNKAEISDSGRDLKEVLTDLEAEEGLTLSAIGGLVGHIFR